LSGTWFATAPVDVDVQDEMRPTNRAAAFPQCGSGVLSEAKHSLPSASRCGRACGTFEIDMQAQGSLAGPDRRAGSAETATTEPASGVSNSSPLLLTSLLGLLPAIASSLFHNRCHAMLCSALLYSALLFLSVAWEPLPIPTCTRARREPSTCLGFRLALHAIALSSPDARLLSHIILALA
jgi:hypothetical protein